MSNKNIAIFIENYVAGGSDKIARDLIDHLRYQKMYLFVNKNNDFSVLLSKELPINCEMITYNLVTIAELGSFANRFKNKNKLIYIFLKLFNLAIRYPMEIFYVCNFYFLFKKYPLDLFFSNNGGYPGGECNRMATLSASLLGVKNYHIIHNLATAPSFKLFKLIEYFIDWLICKKSTLICVSNQTKEYLLNKRYITGKVLIVYNGVKKRVEKLPQKERSNDYLKILNIGAIGDRKNQILIIEALHILKEKGFDNFQLSIVGKEEDKGYTEYLKSKITEYGLESYVFFEGFQSDPYPYYEKCDLFVLSSTIESFALVRVEAMSMGLPVITTDVGDANLQIENGKNGYIINNALEMATAIACYLNDTALLDLHAKVGFDKFINNFTIDRMINQYQDFIDGEDHDAAICKKHFG